MKSNIFSQFKNEKLYIERIQVSNVLNILVIQILRSMSFNFLIIKKDKENN